MFNDAIWEHIDRFTKAKKTSEIQQQLERFSHQMGFDYFRLLIIFPISMQKSHVALFNNCQRRPKTDPLWLISPIEK